MKITDLKSCFQDSLAPDEGDLSTPGTVGDAPLEEAANVKGKSKVGKAPSKKPKEGKGKVKSGLKVEGGFRDQTAENLIKSGSVSESSTLQEDSTIYEAKGEVSKSLAVSEKGQQKSGKLPANFSTAKQPVKKVLVAKAGKPREKSGKQTKKGLAKPPSQVVGENLSESLQCPLLQPACSASQLCHCAR